MVAKLFLSILFAVLSGCAPLPPKPGFDDVQSLVGARLSQEISWRHSQDERLAHDALVSDRLQAPLTLDTALGIALINNPRLQASYEQLGMNYGELVQAGLPANPSLALSLRSSAVGIGRSVGIVQDILSLLTLKPRSRLATARFEETKLTTAEQVLQLATETKKAYFTAFIDRAAVDLAKDAVESAAVSADLAERQYQAGNIGQRELALRQEFQGRATLGASRHELARAESREHLSRLLGLKSDQRDWRLANIALEPGNELPTLNRLESKALKERYDLAAAKKRVDRLADALGVAQQFRYLSLVGLGLDFSRETDGEKLHGPKLELGLPLWDRGQGNRLRMQAELRESERNLEALALDVIGEVRGAYTKMENARTSIKHFSATLLPLHQRIVAETLKLNNGMLLGVYDLLLARSNQLDAQRDYLDTVKSYWLARADLEHAIGGSTLGEIRAAEPPAPQAEPMPAEHKHH